MADDILTRNAAGELTVRTTQTTGDIGLDKNDVYTRDAQGRLVVRTTGTGGGGGGVSNAADLVVSPAGMEIITSTNAQGAFQELDEATKVLQDQASVLTTSVDLGADIGATTTVPLSSLVAMNIDGRPSYKQAGATVYAENGVVGIIDSVDSTNAVVMTVQYSVGGGTTSDNGIKGDYCSTYGITDMPNGVIETVVGTNNLNIPAGIVLKAAGSDTLTTLASETIHETTSTTDFTLFYVAGEMLECGDVQYSETEPSANGTENYQAWFNPRLGKWQFRSNDTGNVWREAIATPLCDCLFTDSNLVRIDFVGYRVLNKQLFGSSEDIDWTEHTFTMPSEGSPGWLRPVLDFGALSDGNYRFYFAVAKMATADVSAAESLPMCEWCIEFKIENGAVVCSQAGMIGELYGYYNVSVFNSNITYSFDTTDSTKIRLFADAGDPGNAFLGCDVPIYMEAGKTFVAYKSSLLENLGTGAKSPIGFSIFSEMQTFPVLRNSFNAYQNPLVRVPDLGAVNTSKTFRISSSTTRYVAIELNNLVKGEVDSEQSYLYNAFGRKVLGYITDASETFVNELEFQWTALRSGSSVEITKKTGIFANVKKFDIKYLGSYNCLLVFDLGADVDQQLDFVFNLSWFGKGFADPYVYMLPESQYESFGGTIVETGMVVNRSDFPSGAADGTYVLKATVVNGVVSMQWILES